MIEYLSPNHLICQKFCHDASSIKNNKYIPNNFVKVKKNNHKQRIQTYLFDHEQKEISLTEEKEKLVSYSDFDPISFEIIEKKVKEKSVKNSILDVYHANDVLSTFLNTVNNFDKQREYVLNAVGAHNDEKDVSLQLLNNMQKSEVSAEFSTNIGKVCNLNIKPFDKDEKIVDILIAFDNDGYMKEAVLGEIFWIGKITAKRLYHNVARK